MLKLAVASLLLCALLAAHSEAAIARVTLTNPDHPGKCVLDSHTVMSPGQKGKAPNLPCAEATCMENGRVEIRTCSTEAPPKGCKIREFVNLNREYPACCERTYDCTQHV